MSDNNESKKMYEGNLENIAEQMKPIHWLAFEVIVSQGISEEKIAKNAIIDKIILQLKDIVSDDAAWRYIKHLVALQLFKVQRIDTGYRQFNVLLITEIGRMLYMMHFRKKVPVSEAFMFIKEHASLQHGYMIKDASILIRQLEFYDSVTTGRRDNFIKLENGRSVIPDIIATFAEETDYFEVECGNHKQIDFNDKCSKLATLTDRIIFIGRSFEAITNILKPQIDKWIMSMGRERLCQLDKTVYLASIIDIKKNRWSYVFDMEYEDPIRNIPIIEREEFDYE